ncbi:CalY family protein [Oceanobacillus jordanicus]|uniref:M73 family metallopeptidase n=1 Tax=Oceanobacillus jordanicus TaxID=2867266 RepID=A0AAW5B846_9BACI|nr:CalY family protein [Oceanobacillus jordanicus]MCG3420774.1 M73 family metallopeptidase [Oceanobacillus jordanicus]NAO99273.1 cell division protein FtsN [Halomonas sp. MG34]
MKLKKQLSLALASSVLGVALISGGTYAYFSDQEVSSNSFAAGTLDLSMNETALIELENLKPGDTMMREFNLANDGSLKIENVFLETAYSVNDIENNNAEDYGKHIKVNFLWNWDQESEPVFETTLYDLQQMDPDVVKRDIWDPLWEQKGGLDSEESHDFWVEFEFVDNDADQNMYQGDALSLEWTFNATQGDGEEK